MTYIVEPPRVQIRFKRKDREVHDALRRFAQNAGLSLSEAALTLLQFAVGKVEHLPFTKQRQWADLVRRLHQ